MKQTSRGARKLREQLAPHLADGDAIEYVTVAMVKPAAADLTGQITASVLSGGHHGVFPVRKAAVFLTTDLFLVVLADPMGKIMLDHATVFPRREVALSSAGGAFSMKYVLTDAAGQKIMNLTFPLPNRQDAAEVASLLGPAF